MAASCALIVREKFPDIDEELFHYITGKLNKLLAFLVATFGEDSRKKKCTLVRKNIFC